MTNAGKSEAGDKAESEASHERETIDSATLINGSSSENPGEIIWDADCPDLPLMDEAPEYRCGPKLLKNKFSTAADKLDKDITETGSFDMRWIPMASFGKLLEVIPMPVLLVDPAGEIHFTNKAFEVLCDNTRLTNASFFNLFHAGGVNEIKKLMDEALALRKPQLREGSIVLPYKEIWTRIHIRPVRFGVDRSLLVLLENLTTEKRELTLNAKYKKLVDMFPIGIAEFVPSSPVSCDGSTSEILAGILAAKLIGGNTRFAVMHGYSCYDSVFSCQLGALSPNVKSDLRHYIKWIEEGFPIRPFDSTEADHSDNIKYYETTLVGNITDGILEHFWLMKQDVTDYIRVQEELAQKIRTIDELYEHIMESGKAKAIAEHTAKVAHELRQPLAIIGGFARRIAKENSKQTGDSRGGEEFEIIIREIARLEKILGGLIDFSRRETLELKKSFPNEMIKYVIKINTYKICEKKINVRLALDDNAAEVTLDPDRFQQVLRNLVANAIEACPPGGDIRIETSISIPSDKALATGKLTSLAYFELKVGNDCDAISPHDMERIFDPFYTTKDYGTGLGLTLAKKIVEDHDGSISVKSDQKGAVFTIWIPMQY